ncbi:T7SS effector LXG polymorphic toxin [Halalkalibacterium halodurans]|uniref:T7SS effector LXG polymorphic toxin n=2 Tax=Halalkalibacterium halodurans TaxID=86665 RepID=UPI002E1CE731|nr:T7SS effector LXG polymorphic toxin [Halalkalibacterium halodurans]MED4087134.1 T7SS effector LXG polymorphic toxin [Halalkalibacterium halodurans]MED4105944.1 T7SS effector LXG polymorphic toxin [Halalkalibacterium halodurans]MED4110939.1 T7SS effector LXG polymorphic toxin [Halalkalibacterium halodurans]MED4125921.1 T7SS effector LXG polymorphic toxin [Halalkalibacterium halodurans]
MKFLDVNKHLSELDEHIKVLKSYGDVFEAVEARITRVINMDGAFKGEGAQGVIYNHAHMQLPTIRSIRAFLISFSDTLEKMKENITEYEPSSNGSVSEDFWKNNLPKGYDRYEETLAEREAAINQATAEVSHILHLGKLQTGDVYNSVDSARKHADTVLEGLYDLDQAGVELMAQVRTKMEELKATIRQVLDWTVTGGVTMKGVSIMEVGGYFANNATLHEKAPEVSVKLSTPDPLIQYANDFPLRFKYDTMHSIMKVFDIPHHQKWFSDRIKSLPLTSLFIMARTPTAKTSNTVSSAPYHTSLYNVTRMSRGKTSNTVSSAPYHTIPQREPSVWTYANAHYSGDKETVERAAEAIREIQEREKENQEPYNPMRLLSIVLDFLPFVGNAKAGQEAATGVDLITEEELDEWDRGIAAASVVLGGVGRIAGRTLKNIIKGSDDIPDALRIGDSQATGGTINNLNKGTGKNISHPVLDNTRSGSALKKPDGQHGFNDIIDNYTPHAKEFEIVGGDGAKRKLYQIEGGMKYYDYKDVYNKDLRINERITTVKDQNGIFEWIVDPTKGVTHRRFIPNGQITGSPNQRP